MPCHAMHMSSCKLIPKHHIRRLASQPYLTYAWYIELRRILNTASAVLTRSVLCNSQSRLSVFPGDSILPAFTFC